jgi:hypothetical protein
MPIQTQEQSNVIFVLHIILKMGYPVFMADNEGFRKWLSMLNPRFRLMHRMSISSMVKHVAAASSDELKQEIKAALTRGSKLQDQGQGACWRWHSFSFARVQLTVVHCRSWDSLAQYRIKLCVPYTCTRLLLGVKEINSSESSP